ncbi:MAG: hypothetical protein ACXWUZ_03795 [Allosphingosinicella sp.]
MTASNRTNDLLARVAEEVGLPRQLLADLAALEDSFPDMNVRGAKPELGRRIAELLDAAVAEEASR